MVCLQTTHCAILLWSRLFGQRFLVRPFTGRDRVVRIDADVWTAPCVDADPVSCAHRIALAGEQETRVVHDTLQLGEHITRDKILAHHHDGIGLKAMLLRLSRQCQQRGAGKHRPDRIHRSYPRTDHRPQSSSASLHCSACRFSSCARVFR